jgi:hypothetical protein
MPIAAVQVKGTRQSSAGDVTITMDANITAGNTVAVLVASYSGADITYAVTDQSNNNAFSQPSGEPYAWDATFGIKSSIFYLTNAPSGISGVKCAGGGTAQFSVAILEFSGGHLTVPVTGTPSKADNVGTAANSGNTTPAVDGSLLFGGGTDGNYIEAQSSTNTLGSGFSVVFNGGSTGSLLGILGEYLIQTTAAVDAADWTISNSSHWWGHVVAFQPVPAGAAPDEVFPLSRREMHHYRRDVFRSRWT